MAGGSLWWGIAGMVGMMLWLVLVNLGWLEHRGVRRGP
jgi:hypothetical protein